MDRLLETLLTEFPQLAEDYSRGELMELTELFVARLTLNAQLASKGDRE